MLYTPGPVLWQRGDVGRIDWGRCVGARPCAADGDRHGLGVRYAASGDRVPRADRGGHAVHRAATRLSLLSTCGQDHTLAGKCFTVRGPWRL